VTEFVTGVIERSQILLEYTGLGLYVIYGVGVMGQNGQFFASSERPDSEPNQLDNERMTSATMMTAAGAQQ